MHSNQITTAFFAYGSETPACGEAIEAAIREINNSSHPVKITSWKELSIGGNFLISKILRSIEENEIFCCDITNLNENVLFELGFAIGRKKPIWIIQDITISASYQRFKEFILLNNIGYINYTTTKDIVQAFTHQRQYLVKKPLIDDIPIDVNGMEKPYLLVYLKSQIDTNSNQYIVNAIEESKIPYLIDDSNENKVSPISWYLKYITQTPSILIEFSGTDRSNYQIHNAKSSFIAGLTIGLNKKYLLIAAHPYATSIDYQEHLQRFSSVDVCKGLIIPFLKDVRNNAIELFASKYDIPKSTRQDGLLQKIKFGEMLAEHESNDIYEYYINTANDDNLLKAEYNIIVGRKGSGKTAAFYYLNTKYSKDVRNQVVVIKPINFEIDGLIELLQDTNMEFGKSYIIESVWKFLIYTEILKSIYLKVKEKPQYALKSEEEEILNFVNLNTNQILPDLSSRLNQLFSDLKSLKPTSEQNEFRIKVSEVLHQHLLKNMISLIINYMIKKGMLILLIDNLDKNWKKGSNIEIISKFILGLLGVIGRINKELKGGNKNPVDIRMNLVIFLRSDIFKQLLTNAREPDKIEYTRLIWTDPEVLFRLIDRRIDYLSTDKGITSNKFWIEHITDHVNGTTVKEYIINSIIPRPRDLIFFINAAKNSSVAKGYNFINENDLKSAYEEYSNWVFQSLMVENGITISQLKEFFYHLVGENSIIKEEKIIETMMLADIPANNPEDIEYFISHICSLSFIGREIRKNEFHFDYGYEIDDKKLFQSKKLNSKRYKIHNAFIPYMECEDYVK